MAGRQRKLSASLLLSGDAVVGRIPCGLRFDTEGCFTRNCAAALQAVAALGPAQAELLGRLTSEPRMKRVWREFGRRRRSDGAPLYPVGAPKLLLMSF